MGFQGIKNQGTDPLQLFLAIRQLRQQEQASQQQAALDRVKAMQDAQAFAQRTAEHESKLRGERIAQMAQLRDIEGSAGPLFNEPDPATLFKGAATEAQKDAAAAPAYEQARQLTDLIESQIATRGEILGQGQSDAAVEVGRNLLAGSVQNRVAEREAVRADDRALSKRAAEKQQDIDFELDKQDALRRAEAGRPIKWDAPRLDSYRNKLAAKLQPWLEVDKQRRNVARLDFNDPSDVLEAMTLKIKNDDDGAVVRESDIDIYTAMSASTMDEAFAKMKRMVDRKEALPASMGEIVKKALNRQHEVIDELLVEAWDQEQAFADRLEWTENQRNNAFPAVRRNVQRARARLIERGAITPRPSDFFKNDREARNAAAAFFGIKQSDVTPKHVSDMTAARQSFASGGQ